MVAVNRRNRLFLTSHELTSKAQKGIGILILLCAFIAVILANLTNSYLHFWDGSIGLGHLTKREFVDEFVMSIFFFAAGMEMRHEFFHGHLKEKEQRRLPIYCALGGIITPISLMLLFVGLAHWFPLTDSGPILKSLPVPIATDTVFALALLSFLSKRVPRELRSLVLAFVVIDDVVGLGFLSILKGDIPPTVIAVILGFFLPGKIGKIKLRKKLMYYLTFLVNFGVLPLFALANAGVEFKGIALKDIIGQPLFWSLIVSQLLGKILGVYFVAKIATKKKWAALPHKCELRHMFVAACSAGIGFTLSLYLAKAAIGDLEMLHSVAKIAIVLASITAGVIATLSALKLPIRIRPKGPDGQELPLSH